MFKKNGVDDLHSDMAYHCYADYLKATKYDKWVLFREGEKAFNDKIEPYIRNISKLEVGDVFCCRR